MGLAMLFHSGGGPYGAPREVGG
ncbi:hypothetical protein FRAAL0269 [Frankia alni ACN14a]|uniref:Uncharacterized protein n=1 Tax=Frankia alni (strain DSM 45986 / CECT 9034 / ACN14a) TaxID=326424 RepID=Q0RTZ9_FRAAA|nr:hypothetical protein FRAAL0269 [Frankia alni ACN14a]